MFVMRNGSFRFNCEAGLFLKYFDKLSDSTASIGLCKSFSDESFKHSCTGCVPKAISIRSTNIFLILCICFNFCSSERQLSFKCRKYLLASKDIINSQSFVVAIQIYEYENFLIIMINLSFVSSLLGKLGAKNNHFGLGRANKPWKVCSKYKRKSFGNISRTKGVSISRIQPRV